MGHGPMMRGFGGFAGFRDLQVSIPLADGQWLSFVTALPAGGPAFSAQFLLSMGDHGDYHSRPCPYGLFVA